KECDATQDERGMIRRGLIALSLALTASLAVGSLGFLVTDRLEHDNAFCVACHLHTTKMADFEGHSGALSTLATAHNGGTCIACHGGATLTDKLAIKALAARDTVVYLLGHATEPTQLRYDIGSRACLVCHREGKGAFHGAPQHQDIPTPCYT